jgi:hypothetical protein
MSAGWSDEDALAALREARVTASEPAGGGGAAAAADGEAPFSSSAPPPSTLTAPTPTQRQNDGDFDDWRTLYRTLVGSLRASSSSIFRALSLETIVLGFRALTSAHSGERDDLPGTVVAPHRSRADAALVDELLEHARWATAFDGARTSLDLARNLRVPLECVRHYSPDASPLEPAHAVVVDPAAPRIHVAVRGTTTWHDALTDLVAHTEILSSDDDEDDDEKEQQHRAHAGMLSAARALHRRHTPLMLELLSGECAGYRVHVVGHSLGGGTAAILAHLWRRRRRQGDGNSARAPSTVRALASAVECTTYGCPPTVTPALARRMAAEKTLSLVYNHDLVPRASVASLAALRKELEAHASDVAASSPLARWVRETGALTATQKAAGQLLSLAAAAGAARAFGPGVVAAAGAAGTATTTTTSATLSRFMRAGFSVGAAALADKFKELHASAMAVEETTATKVDATAAVAMAVPGEVLFLRREGVDADATFELRRVPADGPRPERILLKRSMLRDHLLTHMVRALKGVKEAAAPG